MSVVVPLPARRARAAQHYSSCALCEHRCGVNRAGGERGRCNAGPVARVFRQRVECGEELELIPSHLIYLSGCDLRCAFCIAGMNAFDPSRGVPLTAQLLNSSISWGREQGARNIQWVGGEPTIHLPSILNAMSQCEDLPPVVWKSDFYSTPEAYELLDGCVDTYIADFKFGNNHCAERIAGVGRYFEIVARNLKRVAAQGALIVRHLLLPGHFDCCFRAIALWMRDHLPAAKFSIRDGYLPSGRALRMGDLSNFVTLADACRARDTAKDYRLHVID